MKRAKVAGKLRDGEIGWRVEKKGELHESRTRKGVVPISNQAE